MVTATETETATATTAMEMAIGMPTIMAMEMSAFLVCPTPPFLEAVSSEVRPSGNRAKKNLRAHAESAHSPRSSLEVSKKALPQNL